MKSVKNYNSKSDVKYPSLWTYNNMKDEPDLVILFYNHIEGIVVNCESNPNYELGYVSDDWCKEGRIPYNGTITLSND